MNLIDVLWDVAFKGEGERKGCTPICCKFRRDELFRSLSWKASLTYGGVEVWTTA